MEIDIKLTVMAENTNDIPTTNIETNHNPPQGNDNSKTSADMWEDFLDSTTLHGIRYVFQRRQTPIRLIWFVLLLTAGGYNKFTIYRAFSKYYSRPFNTVLSTKNLNKLDFPAVTICFQSQFVRSKVFMTDDDPLFASSGLNISSCAVTSGVRGNRPCGWSLLCCCSLYSLYAGPNCTRQYQQELLAGARFSKDPVNTGSGNLPGTLSGDFIGTEVAFLEAPVTVPGKLPGPIKWRAVTNLLRVLHARP